MDNLYRMDPALIRREWRLRDLTNMAIKCSACLLMKYKSWASNR
jgi:hypothetical protein